MVQYIYYPEYFGVFGSVEAVMILKKVPMPLDTIKLVVEGINQIWRDVKMKSVSIKRAKTFHGNRRKRYAPIAVIAEKSGFIVTGCDCNGTSYYSDALRESGIDIKLGHDCEHLKGVDILAVTPAVFDINPDHPEIIEARKRDILMTWQEFMGKYLQKDKFVIAVAGTHGKSTTTVLTGLALEAGRLDPIVEAGTIYKPW